MFSRCFCSLVTLPLEPSGEEAKLESRIEADKAAGARSWRSGARREAYRIPRGVVSGEKNVVIASPNFWWVVRRLGGEMLRR